MKRDKSVPGPLLQSVEVFLHGPCIAFLNAACVQLYVTSKHFYGTGHMVWQVIDVRDEEDWS